MGFNFFARTERSSKVSIFREEEEETPDFTVAPLKDEGVNAVADATRMDEIASFISVWFIEVQEKVFVYLNLNKISKKMSTTQGYVED
jgi:hypothetical protein